MTHITPEQQKRVARSLLRMYALTILLPLLIIPVVNFTFRDPPEDNFLAWATAALRTNNPNRAKQALSRIIQEEPLKSDNHYRYIWAHFDQADTEDRNDAAIEQEYKSRTTSKDPNTVNIGHYGLGYYYLNKDDYQKALEHLKDLAGRDFFRINYLIGRVYLNLKQYEQAEYAFRAEIDKKGNVRGAVWHLAKMFDEQKKYDQLDELYTESENRQYFSNRILRKLYLRKGNLLHYLWNIGSWGFEDINIIGFFGAVLTSLVWIWFLRRLDVFEPEKLRFVLLAFFGGAIGAVFSGVGYDILGFGFSFQKNGQLLNDLLYCIFGIGLVEETVKVIPFLLMIRFSKQINESVDFIIYASLSGLGFSFIENLLYFDSMSLYIIDERAMICAIGHMFYTSLIGYGIILAKYRKVGNYIVNGAAFFILACVLHGIYDYWLVCDGLPREYRVFSLLCMVVEVVLYSRIINNALNQSEYFDSRSVKKLDSMREFLGASLMGIVLFEYICLAGMYGPELTYAQFKRIVPLTWVLIFLLSFALGNYDLRQGKWLPLLAKGKKALLRKSE